jgi:hypothetical protein
VKRTSILAAALVAVASTVSGQDAPAPARADAAEIRDQIRMMEGNLTTAVRLGAQNVGRRLQRFEPSSLFVTSDARARGFVLEGYGVFFDVDVPTMRQSVVWTMRTLLAQQQREIASLRQYVANAPESTERRAAMMRLRQLEGLQDAGPAPVAQPAPPGTVSAATVSEPAPGAPATPEADLSDPNALYTNSVKTALIDAMLDYSGRLNISANEWLTVAARDSEGPMVPNALDETTTIVLRVKGSDLVAFRTNQLTREEARKRVEVREF